MKLYININKLKSNIQGKEKQVISKSPTKTIKVLRDDDRFKEDSEKVELFKIPVEKKIQDKKSEKEVSNPSDFKETFNIINKITKEIYNRDENQIEYVSKLAEVRGLKPETLIDNKCFYITSPEYIETLFHDLPLYKDHLQITTSRNTLWKKRLVIPIRDFYGNVYGFVGWDKFSEGAKYVEYSAELYRKSLLKVLGLDKIKTMMGTNYLIITEGSFDYFRGIENGLSIIANLGVTFNKNLTPLLRRFDTIFTAYDNDDAGKKNINTISRLHKNTYHIRFKDKVIEGDNEKIIKQDLDDVLKDENNVKRLKQEIELRTKFPNVRRKDIYI